MKLSLFLNVKYLATKILKVTHRLPRLENYVIANHLFIFSDQQIPYMLSLIWKTNSGTQQTELEAGYSEVPLKNSDHSL